MLLSQLDITLAMQVLDMLTVWARIYIISKSPFGDYIEFANGKYIELSVAKHIDKILSAYTET